MTIIVGKVPPAFFESSVRFAGLFLNVDAATPSPVALGPWHVAQYFM
jgi:hypothetical protein